MRTGTRSKPCSWSGPAHGVVTLDADGSFTYTPEADFFGEDSFTYRASDGDAPVRAGSESPSRCWPTITPVFSSTPVTTFTIDADATGFDGDGVFRVAGARRASRFRSSSNWTFREALYNNEVGIYRVSDQDGRVGNLLPGDAGYAKAALAAGNAQVVFASGASAGAHAELRTGRRRHVCLLRDPERQDLDLPRHQPGQQARRADRSPSSRSPAANPDGFDHLHAEIQPQTGLLALRWEDLTRGGDADYNDVVMTATGLAASSDDVMYVYDAQCAGRGRG